MTNLNPIVFFFLLASTLSTATCHAQASFQWKFATGDEFDVKIDQSMIIDTSIDRRAVHHENEMVLDIGWTVKSVDEQNGATIEQVIKSVRVKLELPGTDGQETFQFDSSNPDETESNSRRVQKSFEAILGQPIELIVMPSGEITEVTIPKETLEALREMPGSMQGREMFSEDSIREMFMHAMVPFPSESVNEGESWNHDREFKLGPRNFEMNSQYQYDGPDDTGRNVVSVTSKLVKKSSESTDDKLEIADQSSNGKVYFDLEQGHCSGGEVTLTLTTQVPYRDMTIQSKVTSSQTFDISRK